MNNDTENRPIGVGHNSGEYLESDDADGSEYLDVDSPEHAALIATLNKELDALAREKDDVRDREKDVKAEIKSAMVSNIALAIYVSASRHRSFDLDEILDEVKNLAERADLARHRELLEALAAERKEIAGREKDVKSKYRERGVHMRALTVMRGMKNMDRIEVEEYFDAIIAYVKSSRLAEFL
jgi:uncharacterized protein (UPF0335 family)